MIVLVGEGGGAGEDAVKWNMLVSSDFYRMRTCSISQHFQTTFRCPSACSGSSPPQKYPAGESKCLQTPLPSCCPKGHAILIPIGVKSLESV